MTAQQKDKIHMASAEYLAMERSALEIKHEFFNGEIFAMTGAKKNHVYINSNLIRELGSGLKANKSPCKPIANDMRVKIETGYVYPDVIITCGEPEFEDNKFDTLTNPIAIIEILSASTEAFDRGEKFAHYQNIPTLQEYILVSQNKYFVEKFIRSEGKWEYYSYKGDDQILPMASVDYELRLSEIYWDISFETK